MAGPDKNKFIRMQAPENLEYIPVLRVHGGNKEIISNSFLSTVTRAFSGGEKSCFIFALVMFTAVKDFVTSNDNTLQRTFQHLQGKAGPVMRAGPSSSQLLHFSPNEINYYVS